MSKKKQGIVVTHKLIEQGHAELVRAMNGREFSVENATYLIETASDIALKALVGPQTVHAIELATAILRDVIEKEVSETQRKAFHEHVESLIHEILKQPSIACSGVFACCCK